MKALLLLTTLASIGMAEAPSPTAETTVSKEGGRMDSFVGRTIKWTFDDGPMAGSPIEHVFNPDGTVTWAVLDGPHKGATACEKSYAAVKVSERVWAISYLSASGHALTVVLNLDDGRAYAFGSNDKSWMPMQGRFELPR